jgi:hypothetical protein
MNRAVADIISSAHLRRNGDGWRFCKSEQRKGQ